MNIPWLLYINLLGSNNRNNLGCDSIGPDHKLWEVVHRQVDNQVGSHPRKQLYR